MSHIIILLHFISFTSGIALITMLYFLFYKQRLQIIKHLIYCNISFTALLAIDTVSLYARKNIFEKNELLHILAQVAQLAAGIGLLYFFSIIIHQLIGRALTKGRIKLVAAAFALILTAFLLLTVLGGDEMVAIEAGVIGCAYLLLTFDLAVLTVNMNRVQESARKIVKAYMVIVIIFIAANLIVIAFDSVPILIRKVPYMPMMYFIVNTIGLIFARKYILPAPKEELEQDLPQEKGIMGDEVKTIDTMQIYKNFSQQYGVTERELEIVKYIVEGCSNADIGSRLYISTNTVRNHIYNIYRKTGIKNRYELMSILSKMQNHQQRIES